jgi:hypothetical protein
LAARAGRDSAFLVTADRYDYWNATPQENAAAGLRLG